MIIKLYDKKIEIKDDVVKIYEHYLLTSITEIAPHYLNIYFNENDSDEIVRKHTAKDLEAAILDGIIRELTLFDINLKDMV